MNEDQATIFPFLPKTTGGGDGDPEGGYQYTGSTGRWHRDPGLLTRFPSDLIVPKDRVESRVLTSIPDIWARAHFFSRALIDSRHPGHENVVDEWRGLLAMICFAETYSLNLTVGLIDLVPLSDSTEGNPPIARPLLEMVPHDAFRQFYLIRAGGKLVGATSPFSFVFTPPDYTAPQHVPWQDTNGRLVDPTNYLSSRGGTFQDMLSALKGWVKGLHELVKHLAIPDDDKNPMAELINAWAEDMKVDARTVKEKGKLEIPIVGHRVVIRPLPVLAAKGGDVASDVRIALSALREDFRATKQRSPLVYWKEGWTDGRLVYGLFDSQLIDEPSEPEGSKLADGKINHPWIDPQKLFFTETITKVDLEPGSVRCRGGEQYLLPLRKEVFRYFSADFLDANFTLEVDHDKTVTAALTIPLTGKEVVKISQLYPTIRQITEIDRDAVVLWPNIRIKGWEHYYLFARYPEKGQNEWSCEALGADVKASSEIKAEQTGHIWRFNSPPEAIAFSKGSDVLGMCIPKMKDAPAASGSQQWSVSVDFGTSNTSVAAMDQGKNVPESLDFVPRHLILMAIPEGPAMVMTVTSSFFAVQRRFQTTPFPSVYYPFEIRPNPEAVLHGNIPFEQIFLAFAGSGDYAKYETGLKWETDVVALERVNQFLSQVLIMTFLEVRIRGAKEVKLLWTYPSAFERNRRLKFERSWRAITDELRKSTGLNLKLPAPAAEGGDPTTTESVAVCQYARHFLKMTPASASRAQVTIDVGGATSDVAAWLKSKMVIQSSLRLGANTLADFIRNTPALQELWLDWAKLKEEQFSEPWLQGLKSRNYCAAVNESLRFRSEDVRQGIRKRAGVSAAEKQFLSLVLCMQGGISYYSGLMLKSVTEENKELEGIDVLLSGNGSRSVEWFGDEAFYAPILKKFVINGYGSSAQPLNANITLTPQPKLEVALGILSDLPFDNHVPPASVVVGEEGITIGEKILTPFSDLTAIDTERHAGADASVSSELPVLRRFLSLYNEMAGTHDLLVIEESRIDFAQMQSNIQQQLSDYLSAPDRVPLVAPFVLGVSSILDYIAPAKRRS